MARDGVKATLPSVHAPFGGQHNVVIRPARASLWFRNARPSPRETVTLRRFSKFILGGLARTFG